MATASKSKKFTTVDEYVSSFPENVSRLLKQVRITIQKAAPLAEEVISYNIPGYKWNGALIFFAAYKNHIGLYPKSDRMVAAIKGLSRYEGAKATVRLPLDQPLPLNLVTKMVRFRLKENLEKAKAKALKKN